MKKILITGSFEGAVSLMYSEAGMGADALPGLLHVDFGQAVLNDTQKQWLMHQVPVRYGAGFEQNFGTKLKVVVADMVLDFEADFWTPYGKKVNKERCLAEWKKLTKADQGLAVARLNAYLRYLSRTGIAKADPENYFKKKYYKNDYDNL